MKHNLKKFTLTVLAAALIAPAALMAQQEKEKELKEKEKKDVEQIIITRKGGNTEKMVVEVNGDKVLVNGKEVKGGEDSDITVRRNKIKDVWAYGGYHSHMGAQNFELFTADMNKPMLGVTTEKAEQGVEIQEITKESGAEKAGLKKGDVITKVNDTKIETPDDLSATIKKMKAGDKVTVHYLRDKKQQQATAELSKWRGMSTVTVQGEPMFKMDDFKMEYLPNINSAPRVVRGYRSSGPKLGISVQDSDDGKGVKVLSAEDDGAGYKSGIRENDLITEVEGKTVNSADEVAKIVRESKDKTSVKMKLQRAGKVQTVDVKIPRKLKTADL